MLDFFADSVAMEIFKIWNSIKFNYLEACHPDMASSVICSYEVERKGKIPERGENFCYYF